MILFAGSLIFHVYGDLNEYVIRYIGKCTSYIFYNINIGNTTFNDGLDRLVGLSQIKQSQLIFKDDISVGLIK